MMVALRSRIRSDMAGVSLAQAVFIAAVSDVSTNSKRRGQSTTQCVNGSLLLAVATIVAIVASDCREKCPPPSPTRLS